MIGHRLQVEEHIPKQFLVLIGCLVKNTMKLWPLWLSWLEHLPKHQKLVGWIPSQSIYPSCRFNPRSGQVGEAPIDVSLSHQCLSPSLFPNFLSLKYIFLSYKRCWMSEFWKSKFNSKDFLPILLTHFSNLLVWDHVLMFSMLVYHFLESLPYWFCSLMYSST